jgi:hypothetical protein
VGQIKRGWIELPDQLAKCGNQPQMYILDNGGSNNLKKTLKKYNLKYQLAPPHLHRHNAAERAIRTYKNLRGPAWTPVIPISPVPNGIDFSSKSGSP